MGNDERFLPAACAVWCRRAAVVAVHPAAPADEVAQIATSRGVTAMVCDPDDPAASRVGVPTVTFSRFAPDGDTVAATRYRPPRADVDSETVGDSVG